jgi:hypothetical protein
MEMSDVRITVASAHYSVIGRRIVFRELNTPTCLGSVFFVIGVGFFFELSTHS